MVRTIVELGHSLSRTIIAERSETQDQLRSLRESGCDLGQGFFLSTPVTSDEVEKLLEAIPPWKAALAD